MDNSLPFKDPYQYLVLDNVRSVGFSFGDDDFDAFIYEDVVKAFKIERPKTTYKDIPQGKKKTLIINDVGVKDVISGSAMLDIILYHGRTKEADNLRRAMIEFTRSYYENLSEEEKRSLNAPTDDDLKHYRKSAFSRMMISDDLIRRLESEFKNP